MWKRGGIEAVGTFTMVFVGCGSVAMERSSLEISLAFGAIVLLSSSALVVGVVHISTQPFQSPFGTEAIFRRRYDSTCSRPIGRCVVCWFTPERCRTNRAEHYMGQSYWN